MFVIKGKMFGNSEIYKRDFNCVFLLATKMYPFIFKKWEQCRFLNDYKNYGKNGTKIFTYVFSTS